MPAYRVNRHQIIYRELVIRVTHEKRSYVT